jgi:hypothetical protein
VEKFAARTAPGTVHTLLDTPHDSSATLEQLRGFFKARTFFTF